MPKYIAAILICLALCAYKCTYNNEEERQAAKVWMRDCLSENKEYKCKYLWKTMNKKCDSNDVMMVPLPISPGK